MARTAKPYIYRGWYCTGFGGVVNRKLCREEDGLKKAETELARLRIQLADAEKNAPETPAPVVTASGWPTVATLIDDFLTFVQVNNRPETYDFYRDKLAVLRDRFGGWPTAGTGAITEEDGSAFKLFLKRDKVWKRGGKSYRGVSETTVGMHFRAARRLFRYAKETQGRRKKYGIMFNPWADQRVSAGKERERIMTDAEFEALLNRCNLRRKSGRDLRDMLILLRKGSFRPGEFRRARWEYIRWDDYQIVYPKDGNRVKVRPPVTLITWTADVLRERKARIEAETGRPVHGYIFPGVVKGRKNILDPENGMTKRALSRRIREAVDRCVLAGEIEAEKGGERIVVYTNRHTRGTEMYVENRDKELVRQEFGHAKGTTTERYIHMADSLDITQRIRANDRGRVIHACGNGDSGATPSSGRSREE